MIPLPEETPTAYGCTSTADSLKIPLVLRASPGNGFGSLKVPEVLRVPPGND